MIKKIIFSTALLIVSIVSSLLVFLNPENVNFNFLGVFNLEQSVGVFVVCSFALGVLFALMLILLPNVFMSFKHRRLVKKVEKFERG